MARFESSVRQGTFLLVSDSRADSLTVSVQPPCAIACINILSLDKKILQPLLPGFEPSSFRSRARCSNHWAIPAQSALQKAHHWSQSEKILHYKVLINTEWLESSQHSGSWLHRESRTSAQATVVKPDLVSVRERGIGYWICSILTLNGTAHRNTKTLKLHQTWIGAQTGVLQATDSKNAIDEKWIEIGRAPGCQRVLIVHIWY